MVTNGAAFSLSPRTAAGGNESAWAACFTLGRWLVALLDFKSTLPTLGQLAAQVGQAGRVDFGLQGKLKRATARGSDSGL